MSNEDRKVKLLTERKTINAKAKPTAADVKRLTVISTELENCKADAFARLGALRTVKAINAMRGLQKLANKNNYMYTPEQVEKIIGALKSELESVYEAFTTTGGEIKESFTL